MTEAVEDQWRWLLGQQFAPSVMEMVRAAALRPELRRLFPYLSLDHYLQFSLTTGWPYTEGVPFLRYVDPNSVPDGPAFELRSGDRSTVKRGELDELLNELVAMLSVSTEGPPDGDLVR